MNNFSKLEVSINWIIKEVLFVQWISPPLTLSFCLSTTSYESKQRSSNRPGKQGIVIFDEQEKKLLLFRYKTTQEKGGKSLFLCRIED